jgi:cyclopropane fatty-acyl-phospholipid synthase-like methyltransferase
LKVAPGSGMNFLARNLTKERFFYMGTIRENQKLWTEYDWQQQGDEWSAEWNGTEPLWWATILPRIHAFVPVTTILEIAPGIGRCTQYLKEFCRNLILVDLSEYCITACQQRFSSFQHIRYHVNDGKSLGMIQDRSVDFVFSFDSLVHAGPDVLEAYLSQLARKLSPLGIGFIHHSNLGAYKKHSSGKLRFYIDNEQNGSNWRDACMTAKLFEQYCERVGLRCISQELIDFYPRYSLRWVRPGGRLQCMSQKIRLERLSEKVIERFCRILNDCFSVFTLQNSIWSRPNKVFINKRFMDEARCVSQLSELYSFKRNEVL